MAVLADVVVSSTGLSAEDLGRCRETVEKLGGTYSAVYTERVTHLVAPRHVHRSRNAKVEDAIGRGVAIVTLSWLSACAEEGRRADVGAFRVRPLDGLCVTVTGAQGAERSRVISQVEELGGKYEGKMDTTTGLVIVFDASTEKYEKAQMFGVPTVSPRYLEEVAATGRLLPFPDFPAVEGALPAPSDGDAAAALASAEPPAAVSAEEKAQDVLAEAAGALSRGSDGHRALRGLRVLLHDFSAEEDAALRRCLRAGGGWRECVLSHRVTHVVVRGPSSLAQPHAQKLRRAIEHHPCSPPVVHFRWLLACFAHGAVEPAAPFAAHLPLPSIPSYSAAENLFLSPEWRPAAPEAEPEAAVPAAEEPAPVGDMRDAAHAALVLFPPGAPERSDAVFASQTPQFAALVERWEGLGGTVLRMGDVAEVRADAGGAEDALQIVLRGGGAVRGLRAAFVVADHGRRSAATEAALRTKCTAFPNVHLVSALWALAVGADKRIWDRPEDLTCILSAPGDAPLRKLSSAAKHSAFGAESPSLSVSGYEAPLRTMLVLAARLAGLHFDLNLSNGVTTHLVCAPQHETQKRKTAIAWGTVQIVPAEWLADVALGAHRMEPPPPKRRREAPRSRSGSATQEEEEAEAEEEQRVGGGCTQLVGEMLEEMSQLPVPPDDVMGALQHMARGAAPLDGGSAPGAEDGGASPGNQLLRSSRLRSSAATFGRLVQRSEEDDEPPEVESQVVTVAR